MLSLPNSQKSIWINQTCRTHSATTSLASGPARHSVYRGRPRLDAVVGCGPMVRWRSFMAWEIGASDASSIVKPMPKPRVSRSRSVLERWAGTVSCNGPSVRFNTCRSANSGNQSSTGSSGRSLHSSIYNFSCHCSPFCVASSRACCRASCAFCSVPISS